MLRVFANKRKAKRLEIPFSLLFLLFRSIRDGFSSDFNYMLPFGVFGLILIASLHFPPAALVA